MNLLLRSAAAAALLLPLAVAPASAQNYRSAFGLYGGGLWSSDFNRGAEALPLNDPNNNFGFEIENNRLRLDQGWIAGAQWDTWLGDGRFGVRLNGAYTERPFQLRTPERQTFGAVNTWFGDVDLMVRMLAPARDRVFAPFLSAGLGVVHYNPAGPDDITLANANLTFPNPATQFAGAFGIGTDILPGINIGVPLGIRLEVVDHIAFESPASRITTGERYGAVHHVRATAGIHALFGQLFPPPPVAVLPPPAPPAPPVTPAPPAEEMITVCVINPGAPGGISLVDAIYVPATRDTMVMIEGQRVRIGTATQGIPTAPMADWYVRGAPMALTVGAERVEFVTWAGARVIEPNDLAFLGLVDGLPVYADRNEIAGTALANITPGADLRNILATDMAARTAFQDIEVLYVPTQAVGCVFQPVRRVEAVRKVRG